MDENALLPYSTGAAGADAEGTDLEVPADLGSGRHVAVDATPHLLDVLPVEVGPLLVGSHGLAGGVRGGCREALGLRGDGDATGLGLRGEGMRPRRGASDPRNHLRDPKHNVVATALRQWPQCPQRFVHPRPHIRRHRAEVGDPPWASELIHNGADPAAVVVRHRPKSVNPRFKIEDLSIY